jgi:hypothetical protein
VKPWDVGNWLRDLLDGELVTRDWQAIANRLAFLSRAKISPNADIAKRRQDRVVESSRSLDVSGAD